MEPLKEPRSSRSTRDATLVCYHVRTMKHWAGGVSGLGLGFRVEAFLLESELQFL